MLWSAKNDKQILRCEALPLEEIQDRLFALLKSLSSYCDGHGLRYYLCGGTLLGAVRHQDFIPWDDDVDVMMPRPDYMRLHELLRKSPIDAYHELVSFEAGNATFPFAKLVDRRIAVEHPLHPVNKHLWIDVFPIDGVPYDAGECARFLTEARRRRDGCIRASAPIGTGATRLRAILKLPRSLFIAAKLKACGTDHYARRSVELCDVYPFDTSEYVAEIAWCCGPQERMRKEDLLRTQHVPIRDAVFCAGGNWDEYLRAMYGDYMEVPPPEQRKRHGYNAYWIAE